MRVVAVTIAAGLAWTAGVAQQGTAQGREKEVLAALRAAAGAEARLAATTSLSAEGRFRRVMAEREMSGDMALRFLFPDRFQRTEQVEMPNGMPGPAMATTLDGETGWRGPLDGGGRGMIVFRTDPGPGGAGDATRIVRAEYYRTLLAILPAAAATMPFEYAYAGRATADDGEAHALDITGPDGFAVRLFVDAKSHLPVMMTFRAPDPRAGMRVMTVQRGGSPEEARRRADEMRERGAAAPASSPPPVDHTWYVADHREVDGIRLPHQVSKAIGGEVNEEWEIGRYTVNAPLKAEQFRKSEKQ